MENKDKILDFLKLEGECATSKIQSLLAINYYLLEQVLSQLETEGKIKKREVGTFTYWSYNGS